MSEDDTLPGMPEQPKTQTLPAADPVLAALARIEVQQSAQGEKLDACVRGLGTVNSKVEEQGAELRALHEWKGGVDVRLGNNSMRARAESSHDLEQDAQLAQERASREALASKVDTLLAIGERLDKLAKNPIAKAVGALVAFAIVGWLASHGVVVK